MLQASHTYIHIHIHAYMHTWDVHTRIREYMHNFIYIHMRINNDTNKCILYMRAYLRALYSNNRNRISNKENMTNSKKAAITNALNNASKTILTTKWNKHKYASNNACMPIVKSDTRDERDWELEYSICRIRRRIWMTLIHATLNA